MDEQFEKAMQRKQQHDQVRQNTIYFLLSIQNTVWWALIFWCYSNLGARRDDEGQQRRFEAVQNQGKKWTPRE